MHPRSELEAQAAVVPSAPRVGRVPDGAARPRMMSWIIAAFLHVAAATLLAMQM